MALWAAIGLTGGTSGDLDNISVSVLNDDDRAIVNTGSDVYHYIYNTTSGQAESSPDVIVPDDATGDEAWELVSSGFSGSHNDLTDVNTDDHHSRYTDSEAADAAPVQEVAGKTGSVSLDKSDVGLGNVPNEDATDPTNMDQAGASAEQVLSWDGSKWAPADITGGGEVVEVSSSYTLSSGEFAHADTSGGAFTIYCPDSPSSGDFIGIRDKASAFATNNLTLDGNGKNILGDSTFVFDVDDQPADFEFNSNRNEWIFARR